jgi:hypothetical protein
VPPESLRDPADRNAGQQSTDRDPLVVERVRRLPAGVIRGHGLSAQHHQGRLHEGIAEHEAEERNEESNGGGEVGVPQPTGSSAGIERRPVDCDRGIESV